MKWRIAGSQMTSGFQVTADDGRSSSRQFRPAIAANSLRISRRLGETLDQSGVRSAIGSRRRSVLSRLSESGPLDLGETRLSETFQRWLSQ